MDVGQDRILFEGDTKHNHYQVVDTIYSGRPARVLYSGQRSAAQSGIARDNKSDLLFDYNQRFLELIRGVRPQSLLLIGGGAFTLPTKLMEEFPNLSIDVVELDGELVAIAQKYFGFSQNEHVHAHVEDGLAFIAHTKDRYDTIVVDVFTNTDIPHSFLDPNVATSLRHCLRPDGIVACNIIASLKGHYSQTLLRLQAALQSSFRQVDIYPASYGLSPWEAQNFVIVAQAGAWTTETLMRYSPVTITE
jgi:spermidine synthase